jgi:putative ABC transport system permease protein
MMLRYYFELAFRSLRRNVLLSALMTAAVGVGIGACMTTLTTLLAMSANPIPDKSSQLFIPQIDLSGYASQHHDVSSLARDLSYRDAMALMMARRGLRQTAMYPVQLTVNPQQGGRFQKIGRATYADFFAMFEVPFRSGAAWRASEDQERANVVVVSSSLADRLFPGREAVGRTINLGKRDYRITGVLQPWTPIPRFYDVTYNGTRGAFAEPEDFYLPFTLAIDRQIDTDEFGCDPMARVAWVGRLSSNCTWIQFWVELPDAAYVRGFTDFLNGYALQQRQLGRLQWVPLTALHDVMEWLDLQHIVPEETRVDSLISGAFLVVCLINAVGLILAKFSARAGELSVRRALGASRSDLFRQCLAETAIVGLCGGLLGLALTAAGLWALRALRGVSAHSVTGRLTSLNPEMVLITLVVALIATVGAGLYPALRASRVQPGWQLKSQ